MRIVLISSYAPSLINFRGDMIREFLAKGYEVLCVAPTGDHLQTLRVLRLMGVSLIVIPMERTGKNIWVDLRTIMALLRLFRYTKPDAIISYTVKPVLYGSLAMKIFGGLRHISLITGMPSILLSISKIWPIRRIIGKIMTSNCRIIFQNDDDRNFFLSQKYVVPKQVEQVNGSGVNLSYFSYDECNPIRPIRFLMIARLLYEKGVVEYAQAARIIHERKAGKATFAIVGWLDDSNPDGIPYSRFNSLVEESKIEFLGRLEDVRPAIKNCSVFVLPSYHEGMPRTILEAMAIGRPIITTDVPGCRDTVIDGYNGYIAPAKDPQKLAVAMERFLSNPSLVQQMGLKSRQMAKEKFDVNKINSEILGIIQSC
jgi:glycosyltransferase involved in cell wall biosynthesis